MAGKKIFTLTADPPSVVVGGTSKLTATLTENGAVVVGTQIKFTRTNADGSVTEIGDGKVQLKTDRKGIAQIEYKDISGSGKATVNVDVEPPDAAAVTPATLDIAVYETPLDRKLAELSQKKGEQQKKDLEAAKSVKEVQALEQEIESLKKAVVPPPQIKSTVEDYQAGETKRKSSLATADATIKQLDTDISAQIEKALSDEIVGIQTRITQERKDLKARNEQLAKDLKTLETQETAAKGLLDTTNDTWGKLLTTKTDVDTAVTELTNAVTAAKAAFDAGSKANDKAQIARAYVQLLAAKDKLAAVKLVLIDPPTLSKKLTETWQQTNTQKQSVQEISDRKIANANEASAVTDSLTNLDTKQNTAINNLIDAIVLKQP